MFDMFPFTCLNLKNYKGNSNVNTLITQKCSQFNQKHFSIFKYKYFKILTCFSIHIQQNQDLPCLRTQTLAGKHVEADLGQPAT